MATVTKPLLLDDTGIDIVAQIKRIADAKEANLMGYGGAVTFSNLPSPTSSNLGLFYLITDAFTTTSDFVVGAGVSEPAGKYWAVINIGTQSAPVCKYDELGTLIDLSAKQDKVLSSPITVDGVQQTQVESTLSAINTLGATNKTNIGTLSNLTTTDKSSLVGAINEVNSGGGGGHTMIPVTNDIATLQALNNGNDNYVGNAYTIKRWSNVDVISILTTAAKGTDTIGTWVDGWKESGASRVGWLWDADLYGVLSDDSIEVVPVFDMANSEVVSIYAIRIDDDVTYDGVNGGAVAFKFNGKIQNNSGVKVGLNLKHQRTNVKNFTVIPSS